MARLKVLALAAGLMAYLSVTTAFANDQVRVGQAAGTQQAQQESDDRISGILLVLGLVVLGGLGAAAGGGSSSTPATNAVR